MPATEHPRPRRRTGLWQSLTRPELPDEADEQACAERLLPPRSQSRRALHPDLLDATAGMALLHLFLSGRAAWLRPYRPLMTAQVRPYMPRSCPKGAEHPRRVEQAGEVDEVRGHDVQGTTR
jgi:hypothetical protein